MDLGENLVIHIKELMEQKNMSDEELADKMGFSVIDISKFLNGELLLTPIGLNKAANALGVTKQELVRHALKVYIRLVTAPFGVDCTDFQFVNADVISSESHLEVRDSTSGQILFKCRLDNVESLVKLKK